MSTKRIDYTSIELIKEIWSYILPYRTKFIWGTIARIISDIVWLFPPWALSEIITFAANYQPGNNTSYPWKLLIAIFAVALIHFIFREVAKYLVFQVAENVNIDAHKKVLRHLFAIDLEWHEKENSGNKMQKITKGGGSLNKIIRLYINLFVESTINFVAILFILMSVNKDFAFILIFFFVTYYLLSFKLTKKPVEQSHVVNLEMEKFSGLAFEAINNISTVKSLRLGEKIFPFLVSVSEVLYEQIRKRIYFYRVRTCILDIYQEFFRLIIVGFTLWQIFLGNLEVGILAMVLLYFGKIVESAYEFAETYSEFVTAKIDMYRMKEIMLVEPEIENAGSHTFNDNWKELRFQNLSFGYYGQEVLKNISLTVKKGEKIGIIGISGGGKSTLFKLLLKLYQDYQGEILFDNCSLKEINRANYIKRVAVVPQETELFNLSLKENITFSKHDFDQKLFEKALKIAHVDNFIYKLPQGVDSLVGEKGIKLSGGERQRVGIARAIYHQPEILLLDEATSHLDVNSEKDIQEALHSFFKDITAIVIAHRLSTITEMDKIVVMGEGRVLEVGSLAELIKNQGPFFHLWEKQRLEQVLQT